MSAGRDRPGPLEQKRTRMSVGQDATPRHVKNDFMRGDSQRHAEQSDDFKNECKAKIFADCEWKNEVVRGTQ
jgi:hypothetical protein